MLGSAVGCAGVRASGISCVNTTGKPIQVAISLYENSAGAVTGALFVNAVVVGYGSSTNFTYGQQGFQLTGIVSPGSAYYVSFFRAASVLG